MIKILIIPQALISYKGGVYESCKDLASLFENDSDIHCSILPDSFVCKRKFLGKNIFKSRLLWKHIKQTKPDIIDIHGFAVFSAIQAIIIAKTLGEKIIYSPHYHPFYTLNNPRIAKLFFILFIKPFLKYCNAIVTINNTDTHFFLKFCKNVLRIPHFVKNNPLLRTNSYTIENTILFVGRNEQNKGIEYINKIPHQYTVHCVTDTPILQTNVINHHNLSEDKLGELYQMAQLVVVPSRYEAFSLVAMEAMNHGTPVLMSDRVEFGRLIENLEGYTVFKYGDPDDFVQKIEIAKNKKVNINQLRDKFSKEKIKIDYKNLFIQIAKTEKSKS